jgi:hypothetical protein
MLLYDLVQFGFLDLVRDFDRFIDPPHCAVFRSGKLQPTAIK